MKLLVVKHADTKSVLPVFHIFCFCICVFYHQELHKNIHANRKSPLYLYFQQQALYFKRPLIGENKGNQNDKTN